jgi:predicted PurR-regulated permease PerM
MSPALVDRSTAWRLLVAVLLIILAWAVRDTLLLVFGAVVVAILLRALASPLIRHASLKPRRAVLLVLLVLLAVVGAGLWLLGEPLAEQLQTLRSALPEAWAALRTWLQKMPAGNRVLEWLDGLGQAEVPWKNLAVVATAVVSALSSLLLIVLMGVYLALDARRYRDGTLRLFSPARRPRIGAALDATGHALTRWLLGQAVMMVTIGLAVAIGLSLLGMPMALALGVIAGLLEFVPFFGPIAAGVLAVLVAFVQGPQQALYVALLFLALQQIEENALVPMVQRWAVSLPPVLGFAGVLVFGGLFGPLGVVFGTPLTVVAMVLVRELYVHQTLEGRPPQGEQHTPHPAPHPTPHPTPRSAAPEAAPGAATHPRHDAGPAGRR